MLTLGGPLRWQVGHDAFWIACGGSAALLPGDPLRDGAEFLDRFQLADLWKGRAVCGPDAEKWSGDIPTFSVFTPAGKARDCGLSSEFDYRVHCDHLPAGPFAVRQFLLTNARGRVIPAGKAGEILGFRIEQTAEEKKNPHWSFTVHRYETKWDPKEKQWKPRRWEREEALPVAFRERFFCLGSGDDWFFLTHSGRLFHAAPAPRGEDRKLVAVWDDPRRPIEGQIQDSSGRTFLFVSAAGGGKPACFELSAKPKLVEYDPDRVHYLKADEPLRRILHRVAVLETLKLLPPAR
jgi:hypothetical protein